MRAAEQPGGQIDAGSGATPYDGIGGMGDLRYGTVRHAAERLGDFGKRSAIGTACGIKDGDRGFPAALGDGEAFVRGVGDVVEAVPQPVRHFDAVAGGAQDERVRKIRERCDLSADSDGENEFRKGSGRSGVPGERSDTDSSPGPGTANWPAAIGPSSFSKSQAPMA